MAQRWPEIVGAQHAKPTDERLLGMINSKTYFLKISGFVSSFKKKELQQTAQFVFNHLPPGCLIHNLAFDIFDANLFHIYLVWESKEALATFQHSGEYLLLEGCFEALGVRQSATSTSPPDVLLFEGNLNDSSKCSSIDLWLL